ncbi:MAG: DUF4279 domain-containing protein [Chloroflexota bacterium]
MTPETGARVQLLVSPIDAVFMEATVERAGIPLSEIRALGMRSPWWEERDPKIRGLRPWDGDIRGEVDRRDARAAGEPRPDATFDRAEFRRGVDAAIRIMGPDLDSMDVARMLHRKATQSRWPGDVLLPPPNRDVFQWDVRGMWMLDARSRAHVADAEDLWDPMAWLLDAVERSSDAFLQIVSEPEVGADLFALWIGPVDRGGPRVEPDLLARLGALHLTLALDVRLEDSDVDPWLEARTVGLVPNPYVALRIIGPDLNPAGVARELGIAPTWSHRQVDAGQTMEGGRASRPYPSDMWFLDLRGDVDSQDIGKHLEALLDRVERSRDAFLGIVNRPGVQAEVVAGWSSSSASHGGQRIGPDILTRLGELHTALQIQTYSVYISPYAV